MGPNMKDIGKIIKRMGREHFGTFTEIGTRANGKETKHTDLGNILIVTERPMKAIGEMIYSMDQELNSGMITQDTKVIIIKGRNTGKGITRGKTAHNILVIGMKIKYMELGSIDGTMADSMKETGQIIIWTDMACILGKTAENMKDNIRKIKSMVTVYTHGQMAVNTMGSGRVVNNMGEVNTYRRMGPVRKEFGSMERERRGSMNRSTDDQ